MKPLNPITIAACLAAALASMAHADASADVSSRGAQLVQGPGEAPDEVPGEGFEEAPGEGFEEAPRQGVGDGLPAEGAPSELVLPRAPAGRWDAFFVDHQPNPEVLAKLGAEVRAHAERSQLAYAARRYTEAYDQALAALALEPDLPPSLLMLGTTAFRLQRYADARLAFERFLEVAPDEGFRTLGLAHAHYSLGAYAAARDHYQRVLAELEGSFDARRGLGLTLYRLGDTEGAVRELQAALAQRPDSYAVHAWLSEVHFDAGALDRAAAAAERAMELDPFDPRAFYTAFRVAFERGDDARADELEARWRVLTDHQAAVTAIENRLLFRPDDVYLHFALLEAHSRMGDVRALEAAAGQLLSLPAAGPELLERSLRVV